MKKHILIIIILAVIALGIGYWQKNRPGPSQSADDSSTLVVGKNAIYVAEQKPGRNVIVEFALLDTPGFVVIRENQNSHPGPVLGVSPRLAAGENQAVVIPLSRAVKNQEELTAQLYRDNGNGIFYPATDLPVLENGEPMMMGFVIDEGAAEAGEIKL